MARDYNQSAIRLWESGTIPTTSQCGAKLQEGYLTISKNRILQDIPTKKIFTIVIAALFGMMAANLPAAEEDATGYKDHPLIPRMPGYYILEGSEAAAVFDVDIVKGETIETLHIEGKSMALLFRPQPELETKPGEARLRGDFEKAIITQGGTLIGVTSGQKWSVYHIVKDGKEFWVVLMINSGEYFTGSYSYRIVWK
ncbi:MAG: hypothetical protein JW904_00780 [Spirochaetales bacterium]|nr:hypothetical protein [Spirochaetales bacterium]